MLFFAAHRPIALLQIAAIALLGAGGAWALAGVVAAPPSGAPGQGDGGGRSRVATVVADATGSLAVAARPDAATISEEALRVDQLLDNATLAMAAQQYFTPPERNARAYYEQVLEIDPGNTRANAGLDRLTEIVLERATAALAADQLRAAVSHLESARALRPRHRLIPLVEGQLIAERRRLTATARLLARADNFDGAGSLLDRATVLPAPPDDADDISQARAEVSTLRDRAAQRSAIAATDAEIARQQEQARRAEAQAARRREAQLAERVTGLVRATEAAIEEGRLLTPEWESAKQLLTELSYLEVDPLIVARLQSAYLNELVEGVSLRVADGDFDAAQGWIIEIRDIVGNDDPRVQRLQEEVDAARYRAESERVASINEYEFADYVEPRYPSGARQLGTEGWVDVEFTVLPDGRTADVIVLDNSRSGNFRGAAVAAVRQWRMQPRTYLGRPLQQRVRTRLAFRLSDE